MLYADTSRYVGQFKHGFRNGKGIFSEREGNEFYGHFIDDKQHGEHICKAIISVQEEGQKNFEIKIGLFEHGKFVKWLLKFSNPLVTRQFVNMFKQNKDMFDSVFSMVLAKNLPNLPEGIDPFDQQVKEIVLKIRSEAGMLVGEQALKQAQQQLQALLTPLQQKKGEIDRLTKEIEDLSSKLLDLQSEMNMFGKKSSELLLRSDKESMKIEQFWSDEPTQSKYYLSLNGSIYSPNGSIYYPNIHILTDLFTILIYIS